MHPPMFARLLPPADDSPKRIPPNAGQYKNVFDCASKILKEEGASAMLR